MFMSGKARAAAVVAAMGASASALQIAQFNENASRYSRFELHASGDLVPTSDDDFLLAHHSLAAVGWAGRIERSQDVVRNAVTLITPRHIIFAAHNPAKPGHAVQFMDDDGVVHQRTLLRWHSLEDARGQESDGAVGLLDEPLPDSIVPVTIGPREGIDYPEETLYIYGRPGRVGVNVLPPFWQPASTLATWWYTSLHAAPAGTAVSELYDSGSPTFVEIDGQLLLVGVRIIWIGDTWVPAVLEDLAAKVEADGERLKLYGDEDEPSATPGCRADMDRDGDADGTDLAGFVRFFLDGSLKADVDEDERVDANDIRAFVEDWFARCGQ